MIQESTEGEWVPLTKDEVLAWVGYIYSSKSALRRYLMTVRQLDPSVCPISSKGYHHVVLERLKDERFSVDLLLEAAGIERSTEADERLRQQVRQMTGLRALIWSAADPA